MLDSRSSPPATASSSKIFCRLSSALKSQINTGLREFVGSKVSARRRGAGNPPFNQTKKKSDRSAEDTASMFGLLLTLILFFYFLIGGPRIGGGLFSLVPPKQRPLIEDVWLRLDPLLKRYFV